MDKQEARKFAEQGWYFRHACKVFDAEKKVSEADFSFILDAARFSPSSFGLEPWRFLIVQNSAIREGLIPFSWGARRQLPTCSHFVVILARKNSLRYDAHYVKKIMTEIHKIAGDALASRMERYEQFQKNDFKLLESDRALFDWAAKQCYIALSTMLNAAALIGVDSCPIEGFDREKAEEFLDEAGLFNRAEYGIACMAAFGYRVADGRAKTRQRMEDIVQWVY